VKNDELLNLAFLLTFSGRNIWWSIWNPRVLS